jgi:nitrogen-specific signal transduction histidine kinase
VTEQVALEEQLAQSQKMEAVGQLTGGVAHDFNNLLAIIVGNLEMIRDDLPEDSPLHKYLVPAMRSASRGGELTHRLLAFSRRQTLEPEHTDTNTLIDGIADIIRRTLGPSIDVEIDLADQLWPAFIDAHQLENAIVNLAINARDAMPEGGKLTIETANIVLDDAYAATQDIAAGDYVLVAVSDTGHGMPAEVIARAFDPFFTTKDVGRGTGLGLSMVYGFVKQSHGHVRIYSEVGEGTSVKLYLPRSGADEADTAARHPGLAESGEGEAATLLVVEDDPDVRDLAVTQLTSLGYRVLDAGNGREALRLFDETPTIDLVVTDLALPGGMNGHDIAVALRERNADMRVLLMSGYTEGAMSHQDRIPTGLKILHKPFTRAQLADAIKETLRT